MQRTQGFGKERLSKQLNPEGMKEGEQDRSSELVQLMMKYQRRIFAYIHTLVPSRSDAEDILQETNLILCRKAKEYDPSGHFQGWAFKIARFQVMRFLTKTKRNKLQFCSEILEEVAMEEFDARKLQATQKAKAKRRATRSLAVELTKPSLVAASMGTSVGSSMST